MKILVTAFEPFGGAAVNPSQMILDRLEAPDGAELVRVLLPVEFEKTSAMIDDILRLYSPDVVLSLGQAGNRPEICIERVAINLDCSRSSNGLGCMADNAGATPVDLPIASDGENAYFATLPVWDIVAAIREIGVAAAVSYTAGTYVCNHVMYTVLHKAARSYPDMKAGFIHVPFLPEQMKERERGFAMPFEDMVKGIQAAVYLLAVGGR